MLNNKNNSIQFTLFSLANFVAACGGGVILGKGIGVIHNIYLGDSILAFFIGTVLGLIFLQSIPKRWSETVARWFSIFGAFSSIVLLIIYKNNTVNGLIEGYAALCFFAVLSIRFGLWFYSRVLRAASTAGKQQQIAWVEFGYYAGMVIGLIIWKLIGIEITMTSALMLDVILQFTAGILDFIVNRVYPVVKTNSIKADHRQPINLMYKKWQWRLAWSIVFLTVGIQVIIFYLAHQMSNSFNSYMLALFYSGVACAAIICRRFNICLEWHLAKNNGIGYATLTSNISNKNVSFLFIGFIATIGVISLILGVLNFKLGTFTDVDNLLGIGEIILLIFVSVSAFCYEILALAKLKLPRLLLISP